MKSLVEKQQALAAFAVVGAAVQVRHFQNGAAETHREVETPDEVVLDHLDVVVLLDERLQTGDHVALGRRRAHSEGALPSPRLLRRNAPNWRCVLLHAQKWC